LKMLKIWLTWLQPSLGVLGIMLVLASPLYSLAAQKPSTVSRASKAVRSNDPEVQLTGIAATPDLAVRQLAIGAMNQSSDRSNAVAAKSRQQSNRDALDTFLAPSTSPVVATKPTKPKFVKRSVTSALARTVKTKTTAPVSGLFIGNSDVRVATRFSPNPNQAVQPIALGTEIGAPTPLSAMMAASKVVDPYPVVRPELMQKLAKTPALATAPVPQPLNPIATMPSGMNKVQPTLKPMATTVPSIANKAPQALKPTVATKVTREVTHSLDPIAKIPSGFHQEVPHSLDPIAAIPSGLQRLLGNNLNNDRPVAPVRVAKASVAKAPLKANSLLALNQLITPTTAPEIASGATLKLATAQAYASVPKFDIPGERLSTVTLAKPATAVVSAKRLQKPALVATVQRKSNYVTLMTARRLESNPKSSWTLIGQRNNLGGLILGSQPQTTLTSRIDMVSTSEFKTTSTNRFSGIRPAPIN
jgi:hypothetical protein